MNAAQRTERERTTLLACTIIVAVNVASLILDRRDREFLTLTVVDITHAVLAAGVALTLVRAQAPWSQRGCELAFVVVTAPFLAGLWLPQMHDLRANQLLEPMLAHHFLLLGIAIAAPSWRSGVALIGLFTIHALALWRVLAHAAPTPALDREPWFTLFFAIIATMLLYTRERRRELESRLAAAEARAQTLTQVSRMLLALRDRANTPLQTLEVAIALLEEQAPTDPRLVLMRRALARLVAIQKALAASELRSADLEMPVDLETSLHELLDAGVGAAIARRAPPQAQG